MSLEDVYDDEVTALYEKFAHRVRAFLIGMGCDQGLAEEITDDSFLGARRRWAYARNFDHPEGYVFKIARNERRKRQKKHDEHADDLHPDPQSTVPGTSYDLAQHVVDNAAIWQALKQLPARQREAVWLRHVAGLPETTTAEIMKVSVGAVKRYASEGRQALRELLKGFRPEKGGRSQ